MDNIVTGIGTIVNKSNVYAIITRRTELKISNNVLQQDESTTNGKNFSSLGLLPVDPGALVKVFLTPRENDSRKFIVQVLDLVRHGFIYENLYECPESLMMRVSEDLWPYIISVQPGRRMRLLNNKEHCQWLTYLKLTDLISVKGELFGKSGVRYDCILRYIGPVQELHPVGYFLGMELLHLDQGHSPQSEEIPFSIKYMQCDPSLSIFCTADWVIPISNEIKKKFSAKQLINETLEKVCTAITPSGVSASLGLNSNASSSTSVYQKKEKKIKPKVATAQFYDQPSMTRGLESTSMDKKSAEIGKTFQIISTDNEDFHESVESYEKSLLERQHNNKTEFQMKEQQSSGGTSGSGTTSILKNRRTQTNSGGKDRESDSAKAAQSTIMSLSDRDIIVIDKADIRESTKDETNVIVVDNPSGDNVDLADLLGGNWPKQAGGAATILNKPLETARLNVETQDRKKPFKQTLIAPPNFGQIDDVQLNNTTNGQNLCEINDANEINFEISEAKILQEVPGRGLSIGSLVEISVADSSEDLFGVIRWIGWPPGGNEILVGVELEEDQNIKILHTSDGSYNKYQLFQCPEGRGVFVTPDKCAIDRRFIDVDGATAGKLSNGSHIEDKMFGHVDCPPIPGSVPPIKVYNIDELEEICGKFKGIQGHHNSCYLDATLFSMFTFTSVFDSLLFRSPDSGDIPSYVEVQKVLREEIVNPLRKKTFVRADRVMKLRKLLDQLSSISGLTSEEKDPEEFLNSLLAQIMKVDPFLKLSSGQDSYFYQLFVEKDERLTFPTVQQLFEQSFHSSDIKLKEVPSCLIIQMPRFGKNFKMYPRILPSQVLDVTDIIEDSPRQCSVCGKLAEYECRECFGSLQGGAGLECTAFCKKCLNTVHMHAKRNNHTSRKLSVPKDFKIMAEHMSVPRVYMELFAVVCIETSHYVTFVKAGSGPDAPWCFFDSMADRKGEKNGYNIPEVISVRELPQWLSEDGARAVNETSTNDKVLPEHAKRLFCDAYMCMYQSTDVMMYR